jgi:DNA-binding protein H-NS
MNTAELKKVVDTLRAQIDNTKGKSIEETNRVINHANDQMKALGFTPHLLHMNKELCEESFLSEDVIEGYKIKSI